MGKISFDNGDTYEGEFEAILIKGKMIYGNGDVYDGGFYDGEKHGKGVLSCKNGDIYTGDWNYGTFSGNGTIKYADGSSVSYYKKINPLEKQCDNISMILFYNNENSNLQIIENKKIVNTFRLLNTIKTFDDLQSYNTEITIETENLTPEEIDAITCPVSLAIMYDPYITSCGHVFNKTSIEQCIEKCTENCPVCRRKFFHHIPYDAVKKILEKVKFIFNGKEYNVDDIGNIDKVKLALEKNNFFVKKENKKENKKESKDKKGTENVLTSSSDSDYDKKSIKKHSEKDMKKIKKEQKMY